MTSKLMENELGVLAELVARNLGLHFPEERWRDLERGAKQAAAEAGFEDVAEYIRSLAGASAGRGDLEILASHLTVGETYFFRERRHFDLLATDILPELIRERGGRGEGERQLRIWSAACCTGEEAYSVAFLLRRLLPRVEDWNITLLASDINGRFLEKAREGVYSTWSFRDAPAWLKGEAYFRQRGQGRVEVLPEIRRMVDFAKINLAEDGYPSLSNHTQAMDVILCRNVLMYFTPAQARGVIGKLHRSQVEGGWLLVGPSELLHVNSSPYATVKGQGAIVYRKESAPAKRRPAAAVPEGRAGTGVIWQGSKSPVVRAKPAGRTTRVAPNKKVEARAQARVPAAESTEVVESAVSLYEQGRYGEAIDVLARAEADGKLVVETDGRRRDMLALLARCQANQGHLVEALGTCDAWVAYDKMDASGHYVRAMILQESRREEEAQAALRRAIYLDHGFVLAHFAMGTLALARGRDTEAALHFGNARSLLLRHDPEEVLRESEGITAGRALGLMASWGVEEKGV